MYIPPVLSQMIESIKSVSFLLADSDLTVMKEESRFSISSWVYVHLDWFGSEYALESVTESFG